jgi:hypothetical protein
MARLLKTQVVLLGVCAAILVTGCAAPMAPQMSKNQPSASQAEVKIRVSASESPKPLDSKDSTQSAASQKQQESLTGQLADSLVNVLATFTGH